MVIRTKGGEYRIGTTDVLLDFLGVKQETAGPQRVAGDVELIASVPFRLTADGEAAEGMAAIPDVIAAIPVSIAWTFSTFDLDRFDERIDPAGWDFKRYMDNPVIEWAHRSDIPAIGRADSLYTDEKGLHGVIIFNDKEYDPFGWAIGQRVKAGVIRAGSVGFRPIEIELPSREDGKDGTTLIFRKQELLEFSICNVPANPWALAKPLALSKNIEAARTEKTQDICFPSFWGNIINNF
jgi:HK97 family phage prohead protease